MAKSLDELESRPTKAVPQADSIETITVLMCEFMAYKLQMDPTDIQTEMNAYLEDGTLPDED